MKSRKYHVALTINDERKMMIINHVREEYGVSEQDFFDVTIHLKDRMLTASGETLDIALYELVNAIIAHEKEKIIMKEISRSLKKLFDDSKNRFQTPVIG